MRKFFTKVPTMAVVAQCRWNSNDKAAAATEQDETPVIDQVLHEKIKRDLDDANNKIKDLNKDYMYILAEAENARRIGRADVDKAKLFGISSFGKDMLDVADTLEKAVDSFSKLSPEIAADKQVAAIATGVKMSTTVLAKHLSKHGIERIEVKRGDLFNPNEHEALFKAPVCDEIANEHITAVVKTGYKIKDRVLRATQVGVATSE